MTPAILDVVGQMPEHNRFEARGFAIVTTRSASMRSSPCRGVPLGSCGAGNPLRECGCTPGNRSGEGTLREAGE
jgi:hypothetical protein